jgi:hypothetical protein
MKYIITLLVLMTAFATNTFAASAANNAIVNSGSVNLRAPLTAIKNLNTAVNGSVNGVTPATGTQLPRVARFTYNTQVDGSAVNGVYSTGAWLPANSVIIRDYFRIDSAFTGTGSKLTLSCGNSGNIKPATDFSSFTLGTFNDASTAGTVASFIGASTGDQIASDCQITAKVTTAAASTGKLTGWIYYIVRDNP